MQRWERKICYWRSGLVLNGILVNTYEKPANIATDGKTTEDLILQDLILYHNKVTGI